MRTLERSTQRAARNACALTAIAAMLACGGDNSTGPGGGSGTKEQWVTAATRSSTTSAETESYECNGAVATTDAYYTGFRVASPSGAQDEIYLTMRPIAGTIGNFDCSFNATVGGELIYAAGPGTSQITFSGGKGVHIAAGQYVLLVSHLNNTSASSVTGSTTVEARVAQAKDVTTPMDMFFSGKLNFAIPSGNDTTPINAVCDIANDLHIVAAIPLMHGLGVHERVAFGTNMPTTKLIDTDFDHQHIIYTSFAADSLVPAGTQLFTSCKYLNTTGFQVNFGESATDENCFAGLYRYPPKPPTSHSPLECAEGGTI